MSDTATVGQIAESVRAFIVDNFMFGVEDENLSSSDSFLENGIIDSTGILELVTHIESEYGITVADEEMLPENLDSLDNVASFVARKQEE